MRDYAVKRVYEKPIGLHEVRIFQKLAKNRRIVRFIRKYEMKSCVFLVLELCPNGSLFDYLRQRGRAPHKTVFIKMAHDILHSIQYVHSHSIIHRDVKPNNYLCTASMTLKLCDFGSAAITDNNEFCHGKVGTIGFQAPEVIDSAEMPYDKSVDVYSIGMTLLFVMIYDGDVSDMLGKMKRLRQEFVKKDRKLFELLLSKLSINVTDQQIIALVYNSIQRVCTDRSPISDLIRILTSDYADWSCVACTFVNIHSEWPKCALCDTVQIDSITKGLKNLSHQVDNEKKAITQTKPVEVTPSQSDKIQAIEAVKSVQIEAKSGGSEEVLRQPIAHKDTFICPYCYCVDAEWNMNHLLQ